MTNPVPGYAISTPYGKRGSYWSCNRDAYGNGIHTGCDYASPAGTKVVAARPGTARYSNHGSAFGYHQLDVIAGDGTRDFYAHMTTRTVADGARVEAGQQVGKVGAEGNVTGPHLHFERHATETGGWSCSVVRDPAPSINYQAASGGSGGGASGGEVEDMPEYVRIRCTKTLKVKADTWTSIPWDADPSGSKVITPGEPGVKVGPASFTGTLTVTATPTKGSDDTIRTRWLERTYDGKQWTTSETWPVVEHKVTGGATYLSDTRTQKINKGNRFVCQVYFSNGGVVDAAEFNGLTW